MSKENIKDSLSVDQYNALVDAQCVLLDDMKAELGLKNDAALSRAMDVDPPVLSKMRHGRLIFIEQYIITCHELTGWSIAEIKERLGFTTVHQRVAMRAQAKAAAA